MNDSVSIFYLIVPVLIVATLIYVLRKKKGSMEVPGDEIIRQILQEHVSFYQRLEDASKRRFENRVIAFLQKVRVTGVKTNVEDADRVFAAASAIIPIFAFEKWEYRNIREILLYPGTFSNEFALEGDGRTIAGMVGEGPMQQVMIISQTDLRNGFLGTGDTANTGIHEFVHLIDKSDGATDGIPEWLLPHKYAVPWLKRMHTEIAKIKTGSSDIDAYGATNEAEFLAVAAEYFFEQPHLLQQKHPELYALLVKIFEPAQR